MMRTWTGREATALRKALRMTYEEFAALLDVAPRTVAAWAAHADTEPRQAVQRLLDQALADAPTYARIWFDQETGYRPPTSRITPAEVSLVRQALEEIAARLERLEGAVANAGAS